MLIIIFWEQWLWRQPGKDCMDILLWWLDWQSFNPSNIIWFLLFYFCKPVFHWLTLINTFLLKSSTFWSIFEYCWTHLQHSAIIRAQFQPRCWSRLPTGRWRMSFSVWFHTGLMMPVATTGYSWPITKAAVTEQQWVLFKRSTLWSALWAPSLIVAKSSLCNVLHHATERRRRSKLHAQGV